VGYGVRLQKTVALRLCEVAAPIELLGVNELPHYEHCSTEVALQHT
jgi:hypothetical protein